MTERPKEILYPNDYCPICKTAIRYKETVNGFVCANSHIFGIDFDKGMKRTKRT